MIIVLLWFLVLDTVSRWSQLSAWIYEYLNKCDNRNEVDSTYMSVQAYSGQHQAQ